MHDARDGRAVVAESATYMLLMVSAGCYNTNTLNPGRPAHKIINSTALPNVTFSNAPSESPSLWATDSVA